MTEQLSTFWSVWVTAIILGSIFGSWALLYITNKGHDDTKEDSVTTGHVYDGIEEYDNPMPKWWIHMFVGSIIVALGYLVLYPGLGNWKGIFEWTSYNQWEKEVAKADDRYGPYFEELAAQSAEELIHNEQAMQTGARLFSTYCSICHGVAATGSLGFPNLTDDDWLYGGTPEAIKTTLLNGRNAVMPARGAAGNLNDEEISQVSAYVRSLSNAANVDAALASAGKGVYTGKGSCFACHGMDAKGNQQLGAPNLTDSIWLYGGTQKNVEFTIRHGRKGVMPAQKETLGEDKVHVLAAYVYSLSKQDKEDEE